jgi:mitochondrial fission protein ELM1
VPDGDTLTFQFILGNEQICRPGTPSESYDVIMLQEHDNVSDSTFTPCGVIKLLHLQCFVIWDFSQVDHHHVRLIPFPASRFHNLTGSVGNA